jgi:hypothetical protein
VCDFLNEEPQRRNRATKSESIRTEQHMNRSKRSIVARASRRPLNRRPKASRKNCPRATEDAFMRGIGDLEVEAGDSFTPTQGLVYAALRVWELKHGFGD